jgi:Fe-S cluster biogenesis protein NfuA
VTASATRQNLQQQMAKIERLLKDLEQIEDADAQASARELVQVLLDLHGEGIERMLSLAYDSGEAGRALIDELGRDEAVSGLLLLHGLHPLDLPARVEQALQRVRPYLASHGGNVELLEATAEGVVRLRLEGSCHGCPSSRATLQSTIEEAIYAAAPDITALEVEGASDPPAPSASTVQLTIRHQATEAT